MLPVFRANPVKKTLKSKEFEKQINDKEKPITNRSNNTDL
jgi:hypothetical protein